MAAPALIAENNASTTQMRFNFMVSFPLRRAADGTTGQSAGPEHSRALNPALGALLALLLCLASPALSQSARGSEGKLVLLGGGGRPSYVMDRIVSAAGGRSARILVIPLAHPRPEEEAAEIVAELERSGAGSAEALNLVPEEPDSWETLQRLEQATGVFLSGGDQSRLATVLHGTELLASIRALYTRGGVVAGESAGATALGSVMIVGGGERTNDPDRSSRGINEGGVVLEPGFGLLEKAIVDQHFLKRRRQNRLLSALLVNPKLLAIGIDEETAVVIRSGRLEVLGEGLVTIYDLSWGSRVKSDANGNLGASGMTLNLLISGQVYDLASRSVR